MNTDITVFVRWPDGTQNQVGFEVVPRIGEKLIADGHTYKVVDVVFHMFPELGNYLYPVIVTATTR